MRSPARAATPRRVISIGSETLDLGLYRHPDGGPVRLRGNGRRHRANGLYFSIKSGRHLPHESSLELHDLWHAEVRTEVVSSTPQPFTLQFMMDGKVKRYTPDREDLLSDGDTQIVEVKPDRSVLDPEYARTLELIERLLAVRGMVFRVRERAEIEAEPRFSAIKTIQHYRRTRITPTEIEAARRLLSDPSEMHQFGKFVFADGLQGLAIGCALVVRRIVGIDLETGLHAQTPVWLENGWKSYAT